MIYSNDIEDIYSPSIKRNINSIIKHKQELSKLEDNKESQEIYKNILDDLLLLNIKSKDKFNKAFTSLKQKYKVNFPKSYLFHYYKKSGKYETIPTILEMLQTKPSRSSSGVLVIALFTKPEHSCNYKCSYCPSEPNQPKSYLLKEPGVLRANKNNFICVNQFNERVSQYITLGHPIDKFEILILGGTWHSYPENYREEFIRDIYYAANTIFDNRQPLTLEEEIDIHHKKTTNRIIGITIETRPDCINAKEIKMFRKYGITRVQLGVQHTDNRVLYRINRQCTVEQTKDAITLLKRCGFKVDIHLMPDLPHPLIEGKKNKNYSYSDIDWSVDMLELDKKMFSTVLEDPYLQADQWKIYPTSVTPYTKIKDDFEKELYKPYSKERFSDFVDMLVSVKNKIHPWIRINRLVRDIPNNYIIGGNDITNLRQYLHSLPGCRCKCIRCREVKNNKSTQTTESIKVVKYDSSGGIEYFISCEDEKYLYGFLRLRIDKHASLDLDNKTVIFTELLNSSIIRELHVYGNVYQENTHNYQHKGIGKSLIKEAENITRKHKLNKICVISGEGVKNYYKKLGFYESSNYLVKDIICNDNYIYLIIFIILLSFVIKMIYV